MSIWILFYETSEHKEDYLYFDSSFELEEFLKNNKYYSENAIGSPLEISFNLRIR